MPNNLYINTSSGLRTPRRPYTGGRIPVGFVPLQPKFQIVYNSFRRKFPTMTNRLFELPKGSLLEQAKAKLREFNILDIASIGNISLQGNLIINSPGLVSTAAFAQRLPAKMVLEKKSIGALLAGNHIILSLLANSIVQGESVIIGNELDLNNKTIIIDRSKVSHLWIIVKTLKASSGAVITYKNLNSLVIGRKGEDGSPDRGIPSYDPHRRQSSSGHHASNGGNGHSGADGNSPSQAFFGPNLTICALAIDAMPDIILPGQKGGRGGSGGKGASGGHGMRGRDSKLGWQVCDYGPGYGGNGGNGGAGGKGGKGGQGGNGGNVSIATLESVITNLITASPFIINNSRGTGGDAGEPGKPGGGGEGGDPGHRVDWPCSEEPDRGGDNGRTGSNPSPVNLGVGDNGSDGSLSYEIITQDEWSANFNLPWITSISTNVAQSGDTIKVFGLNFTNNCKISISSILINSTFHDDKLLEFVLPSTLNGGEHFISVKLDTGVLTNEVPLSLRPVIREVLIAGVHVDSITAGDEIEIKGESFSQGAGVYMDSEVLYTSGINRTTAKTRIPVKLGLDDSGHVSLILENPDGLKSAPFRIKKNPCLDSLFRAKGNGYKFKNFSKGDGSWGSFLDTFGEVEIGGNAISNPVLTGAFYIFFQQFLKGHGGAAHCSGLSPTALKKFHSGIPNLTSQNSADNGNDPPAISSSLMRELDVAQGRVLSDELITHYCDESDKGVNNVELTLRKIESDFNDGFGVPSARVLCFIHSGRIWEIIKDPATREAFNSAHCVVPTRIVYNSGQAGNLDNAKLYIYDCNYPENDSVFIDLFVKNGKLHFKYTTPSGSVISSSDGFTIGSCNLQKQLIDDVDLPFALDFVVDAILSPARISIEDSANKFLMGFKDDKFYFDPSVGYIHPWDHNLMLIKASQNVKRKIVGYENGKYTFCTIHPLGRSFCIEESVCSPNSVDNLEIDESFTELQFESSVDKDFVLHMGHRLGDGTTRYVKASHSIKAKESTKIKMNPNFDGITIELPNRNLDLNLEASIFIGVGLDQKNKGNSKISVPKGKSVELIPGFWDSLNQLKPKIK